MFNWFWYLLYGISVAIYKLIDAVMSIIKRISGMEEITIDGESTDIFTWLFGQHEVAVAFRTCVIVAFFLVMFFTVFKILTVIVKEKPNETPGQIAIKACKTILTFLFIPAIMITLTWAVNTIGKVLYEGTAGGLSTTLGGFIAGTFASECTRGGYESDFYLHISNWEYVWQHPKSLWNYCDLSDYNYFFSWVASFAILFNLVKALMIFIDRIFSLIMLYIISPIPISATIIDDGNHFKIWRDQLLSKFLVAYGVLIACNIFVIVISKIASDGVKFYDNSFLNFCTKMLIILGGAVSLERMCGMMGNLVNPGAGDQEMAAAGKMAKGIEGKLKSYKNVAKAIGKTGIKLGLAAAGIDPTKLGDSGGDEGGEGGGGSEGGESGGGGGGGSSSGGGGGGNKDYTRGKIKNPVLKFMANKVMGAILGSGSSNNGGGSKGGKNKDPQNLTDAFASWIAGSKSNNNSQNAITGDKGNSKQGA